MHSLVAADRGLPRWLEDHWERRPHADVPFVWRDEMTTMALRAAKSMVDRATEHVLETGAIRLFLPEQGVVMLNGANRELAQPLRRDAPCFRTWTEGLGSTFLMHMGALHLHDPGLGHLLRGVVDPISSTVGLPTQRWWVDLYVGRYDQTPFGVHLDRASNLTLGLVGEKTFHLWEPEDYWALRGRAGHFELEDRGDEREAFLARATTMTVREGGAVYWPSRMWHVAEPSSGFCVTLNIAAYWRDDVLAPDSHAMASAVASRRRNYFRRVDSPVAMLGAFGEHLDGVELEDLHQAVWPVLGDRLGELAAEQDSRRERGMPAVPSFDEDGSWQLPDEVATGLQELEERARARRAATIDQWLVHVSSGGLGKSATVEGALEQDDVVRVPAGRPLLWRKVIGGEVRVGAAGHLFTLERSVDIEVLARLNRGADIAVAELVAIGAPSNDSLTARFSLLELLFRTGAIERVE